MATEARVPRAKRAPVRPSYVDLRKKCDFFREQRDELYEALRKLMRHEKHLPGGCSVSADIHQAREALIKAERS